LNSKYDCAINYNDDNNTTGREAHTPVEIQLGSQLINNSRFTDNSGNMQQKRVDQRVATVRKGGHGCAIDVVPARRSYSCTRQDQRPRYNYRPQTQRSSKHSLNWKINFLEFNQPF